MTNHESAHPDLAARLAGTDATLSTSLRDILAAALQELIEAELTSVIGTGHGEPHTGSFDAAHRTSSEVVVDPGWFFPELLEPRREIDKAMGAVIITACITGTSTRKVDDLVKALGCSSDAPTSSGSSPTAPQ
jgi:putative transposase